MATKMFLRSAGALLVIASAVASVPAQAGGFDSAVERLFLNIQDGRVAGMPEAKKRELAACVTATLASLPRPKKEYIATATSLDDLQDRFGEVVMENRAEYKQKIAKQCAQIVVA